MARLSLQTRVWLHRVSWEVSMGGHTGCCTAGLWFSIYVKYMGGVISWQVLCIPLLDMNCNENLHIREVFMLLGVWV